MWLGGIRCGESIENVASDLDDGGIFAAQAVCPVGCSRGDHRASASINAEHGSAGTVFGKTVVPVTVSGSPAGGTGSEDRERFGRTILVRCERQTIFPGHLATVTFVTDDRILATEALVPFESCSGKQPVIGAVYSERCGAVHELTVAAVIATPQETDSGELVFGTFDEMVTPQRAQQTVVAAAVQRVRVVPLFPAGQGPAIVFAANLPAACVAAEKSDVATVRNILFQMVPHGGRPVFIMPDTQDQAIVLQDLWMEFQVAVDGVIDCVAVALCPADKR